MKAIITIAPQKSVVQEVPEPQVTPNTIKIRLKYCGVCYSEHHQWKTEGGKFGHEPVGDVVEVGENVKDCGFQVGDRVSGTFGNVLPGAGGMKQYTVLEPDPKFIFKLPDNVRDEDAMLEPLACLFSAISKVRESMPGAHVCVVGCGYMGCGAISLLKMRGFHVTAVDIRESSRKDAAFYGADEVYSVEEALEKFEGCFHTVMEWGETNESLDTAIHLTQMCGQLCIGAYHTGEKRLVNMQLLNVRAIDMLSTHPREKELITEGCRNAIELLSSGKWNFHHIPTMVYPMSQFDRAQAELETKYGHHMKAIIDMTSEDGEPYLIV